MAISTFPGEEEVPLMSCFLEKLGLSVGYCAARHNAKRRTEVAEALDGACDLLRVNSKQTSGQLSRFL